MRNQKDIAIDAIELVKPAIMNLFERTCRKELHIVVMDPTIKPWEAKFEDSILVEHTIGTPAEWTAPNIVVGCSGVEPYYDMLISSWVALAFEQLSIAEYQIGKVETPKKALR